MVCRRLQLAHPILESLQGSPDAWACDLLKAVAAGDVVAFERIRSVLVIETIVL